MSNSPNLSGHIRIFRKIKKSSIFANEGLLKVWIWCLVSASHKEEWVPFKTGKGNTKILVKPGQLIYGRLSSSDELKMNPNTVRTRMKILEKEGMIKIYPHKKYSIIYITKWHLYQHIEESKTIVDSVENNGEIYHLVAQKAGKKWI